MLVGFLGRVTRELSALADVAASTRTRDELRREVLARLKRALGFDFGIIWTVPETPDGATLLGFPYSFWRKAYEQRDRYLAELAPMVAAAERLDGVINDDDAFEPRQRAGLAIYAEIIEPIGARNSLTVAFGVRGRNRALMQVGRAGGRFSDADAAAMRLLRPLLSLGEAMREADAGLAGEAFDLTPRERQVVGYLALGFTNKEIGVACGTSMNTVHNQVKRIFRKADVGNRAELVRVAMEAGLIAPRPT
jgi:DNA-binding CsgD family transcriptional regulator